MAMFKKLGFFGAPLAIMLAGAATTVGCDGDELCGPCGAVVQGDVGISGNAKVDGFFSAVSTLNTAVLTASADFELGLKNLEAAFGLKAEGSLDARVDALIAEIKAELNANASGGLAVNIAPAKCQANVSIAVEAQAKCEAKADCKVDVDPGSVSVKCEGSCTGSCEGSCEGEVQCSASAGGIECEGTCEGTCEVQLEAGASCEGTCRGECDAECSAYDGEGKCAGSCSGKCEGSCEATVKADGKCEGKCTGSCAVTAPSAGCEGEVKCQGECKGECSGGCEGEATPPSASASCEASADCQAQAKAQGSASLECTPPSIEIAFNFTGNASAEGEFKAKIGALKANAGVMVQAFTKYQALIDGKVDGEVKFKPAPIAAVTAGLQGVVEAGLEGDLLVDIPAGRIACVIPALEESVKLLGKIGGEAKANIEAQASFVGALSTGFKS